MPKNRECMYCETPNAAAAWVRTRFVPNDEAGQSFQSGGHYVHVYRCDKGHVIDGYYASEDRDPDRD